MPEDRKTIIKALVEQYNTASSKDGSPRQCIAEFTGRPLLSLTVGDIGTFEEKVEERLSYWFNLAEKWGAVMLIDEADVYLERRTVSDLRRNGIVSVFLQCMEYYRGILFLTNRVGQFDDAFVSRIHLIIHYSPLGELERRKIWTQFFEKLEDERDDISITSRARKYVLHDPEINDVKWNGREIRNGKNLQTAVALADYQFSAKENKSEHEIAQLDQKHFQQICGMALPFKGYLTNLHGMDEPGRAFVSKARIDGPEE
ncbi:P-loop containing nucleoside triphosphate hydrolase [Apiospora aurea]|uniref:P-loop containing nucleoside triphosphate hydrolase n=1 Tax=Apiospora aurea TaxID=335848 RepID=A0ABR1Q4P6_9PEZI